jgi:hypothetical protein
MPFNLAGDKAHSVFFQTAAAKSALYAFEEPENAQRLLQFQDECEFLDPSCTTMFSCLG